MRFMIASDIHGSAYYCEKLLEAYKKEKADRLILLGDVLYHGPRNDLPKEYHPKKVIAMLNAMKEDVLCVRGNCDTEVDQMVLDFSILADHCILPVGKKLLYATHGHVYNKTNPPKMNKGDILLNGHFHVPAFEELEDFIYMNPGSVSIPKENSQHSYMILEKETFVWKNLDGDEYLKVVVE